MVATSRNLATTTGSRGKGGALVSGFEEINAVLTEFPTKVAVPVVVATLSAGLQAAMKGIQGQIPQATTRGHDTKSIKKSVGRSSNKTIRRLAKGYRKGATAKVGIGVGKAHKTQVPHAQAYVAGTVDRFHKNQFSDISDSLGRFVGRVEPKTIVDDGIASANSEIVAAMKKAGEKAFGRTVKSLVAKEAKSVSKSATSLVKSILS